MTVRSQYAFVALIVVSIVLCFINWQFFHLVHLEGLQHSGDVLQSILTNNESSKDVEVFNWSGMEAFRSSAVKNKVLDSLDYVDVFPPLESMNDYCSKFGFREKPASVDDELPRLFWGVLFNNELDILHMSLYEMLPMLHAFVILEANITFAGTPRKLKFPGMAEQFMSYSDQLVYWPYMETANTVHREHENGEFYGREESIRNSLLGAWKSMGMKSTDYGIVADADEFVSRDFLRAVKHCDVFPLSTSSTSTLTSRCSNRTKLISRINVFSNFVDCPVNALHRKAEHLVDRTPQLVNKTGRLSNPNLRFRPGSRRMLGVRTKTVKVPVPTIQNYWHPDIIPGECLLSQDPEAYYTVEELRTRGGSSRQMKQVVGWHYRNFMDYEDVLAKYRTYGHPEDNPISRRLNISVHDLTVEHIKQEVLRECSGSMQLVNDTKMTLHDIPLRLQHEPHKFRHRFQNQDMFFNILRNRKRSTNKMDT